MEVLSKDEHKVRLIDHQEKNKFKFDWLKKTVLIKLPKNVGDAIAEDVEVKVEDSIKKIDQSGKVMCFLCSDIIYYGKRGYAAISDHIKSKKHSAKEQIKVTNYSLPSNFFSASKPSTSTEAVAKMPEATNVPLCDRVVNSQCLILGILAEKNLPFSMAPVLIDASKALAADKKALSQLKMSRATASYKMRHGLAKTFLDETVENLKCNKFSLNIDEATSANSLRVLCVLCSYFSPSLNKVVIEHLSSLSMSKVSSESLFQELTKLFALYNIPWKNLISILMDSCNVMRGSKTGLEVRIRQDKAPDLLDIDGDSCHHVHNACKKFCQPFEMWVEHYLADTFTDFKWSADLRSHLTEICLILGLKYTAVESIVMHRWLSCYDVALGNLRIFDALTVLYYCFLSNEEKTTYFSILCYIYKQRNVLPEGKTRIKEIHKEVSQKKITPEGKCRKKRIVTKLFYERKRTQLVMNFYIAVLPLLKRYVCLFQTQAPLIHKIISEQKQLFLDFLACFIRQEYLNGKTTAELLNFDLSNECHQLEKNDMFLGAANESIILKSAHEPCVKAFLDKALKAYVACAQHLQKKLPLNSDILTCISALDPTARGHTLTLKRLKRLPHLVKNVLNEEDMELYASEIYKYQVDRQLPPPVDEDGKQIQIDIWWSHMFQQNQYPAFSKIVKALLTCFHGPQVESTFSMMGNILDKQSSNMQIETYSALQTVKYKLLSENKSAVEYFQKKDPLHDPVSSKLSYNLKNSCNMHEKEKEDKRKDFEAKKKNFNSETAAFCSKVAAKNIKANAENRAMLQHRRKRKLELMVKNVQKKKKTSH
jgi:hypothetical protein